jgi:hypothetical protein
MTYPMKPLSFDPAPLTSLSERLLSHYEDNHRGAVHSHGLRREGGGLCGGLMRNIHWDNVAERYASITHPS